MDGNLEGFTTPGCGNVSGIKEVAKELYMNSNFTEQTSYAGCRIFQNTTLHPISFAGCLSPVKRGEFVTAVYGKEVVFLSAIQRWELIEQIQKWFEFQAKNVVKQVADFRTYDHQGDVILIGNQYSDLKRFCGKYTPEKYGDIIANYKFESVIGNIGTSQKISPIDVLEHGDRYETLLEETQLGRAKNYLFEKLKEKNAQITWQFV